MRSIRVVGVAGASGSLRDGSNGGILEQHRRDVVAQPDRFLERRAGHRDHVVGDLFAIGWKTYFWNPALGRFDGIFTSD